MVKHKCALQHTGSVQWNAVAVVGGARDGVETVGLEWSECPPQLVLHTTRVEHKLVL